MPLVTSEFKIHFFVCVCGRNAFLMDKTEIFVVFNSKVISGKSIFIFNRQLGQKGFWFLS